MPSTPLLELENLSTHYVSAQGTRVVRGVDDVSLRIHPGETLGIVGESGSGKSTLALTILRVLPPAARIVSAIGISCEPRLLIADEPTTSLDLTIQAQYLKLLRDLQRAHGLALIFITHNLGIVAKMCDQLAVMYAGRVVESGPVSRIFNAPAHPYTRALLNSIPRMSDGPQRLAAIEGQPPDLAALPPGCSFAPRCPRAFDRCREAPPPEFSETRGRTARCWLAAGSGAA